MNLLWSALSVPALMLAAQPARLPRPVPPAARSSSVADRPDVAVACPPALRDALQPWVEYRQAQGHRLRFLPQTADGERLAASVQQAARGGQLRYLLLVGDAEAGAETAPEIRARTTPTRQIRAEVNVLWGSEPEIATDNPLADLDGDSVPDLAVGRLSVDDPHQLQQVVRKILHYEQSADLGRWRQRINLIAGVGGFSPLADRVLETATQRLIVDGIPAPYQTTLTQASWRSPFCPDPRRFREATMWRLNEGCLFWVYVGHGHPRRLDRVQIPAATYPILEDSDAATLECMQGQPIALLLACYTGAYDQPQECLAEQLLRAPGGPVAVIAGSRVTMPYAMSVLGQALMQEFFQQEPPTLGELLLQAKRRLAAPAGDDPQRQLLDAAAAAFSPNRDRLAEERREHLALFNLLGDPLLRLRYPQKIEVQAADSVVAGESLRVQIRGTQPGLGRVELVCRADRTRQDAEPRAEFDPSDGFLQSFDAVYLQANERRWTSQLFSTPDGCYELTLDVPATAKGPCYACVAIEGPNGWAQGAAPVFVHRAVPLAESGPGEPPAGITGPTVAASRSTASAPDASSRTSRTR